MCGITGLFAFNMVGRINLIHLEEATRCLEKRGPDHQGSWFDDVVGLGQRRLSIIDTSESANQPMVDETGRYRIVFNGEIYNYRQLKKELIAKGISFHTESDTEVLLKSYIFWGADCLNKLNGFFAFAVYDAEDESLFIARDRIGIKPLLYFHDEDKLLFASEMKSMLSYGLRRDLDTTSLHLYFQLTYIPAPYSIIKGVKKLEPGHFIRISKQRGVKIERYYDIPYLERPSIHSWERSLQLTREKMEASVTRRLVSDVPLGAFLSGGVDSSIIVALASRYVEGLNTFSIGYKDNPYFDETKYAELVAKKFKTHHHVFSLTNSDLYGHLNQMMSSIDEPFADSSALPVHLLSKLTRKYVTVALSGDGADEIFSGYNKHSAWLISQENSMVNKLIHNFDWVWKRLPKSRSSGLADKIRQLDRMSSIMEFNLQERYWMLASFIRDEEISRLIQPEYRADRKQVEAFRSPLLSKIQNGSLNEMLNLDTRLVLPGDMLQKVDLMSMANSLEVRVPFLDHEVVELAFQLPDQYKAKGMKRKIVLREAFKEILPKELYHRPKHGFEVPLLDWFKKEMKSDLDDWIFDKDRMEAQGIFRWDEIKRIREKLFSPDPGDVHIKVWSLFVFQRWFYTNCSTG